LRLTFHGAARTVTGSRHLLEAADRRILIDCGLFQGLKKLRLLNWEDPGFDPGFLDDLVLTHAHIDHSGYIPRLMHYGFQAPIRCTTPTSELLELMLMDAAHIQEEDAAWANKKGYSKHKPAEPLYTQEDAWLSLKQLEPADYGNTVKLSSEMELRFHNAGHILGASFVELKVRENGNETTVVFSGDVGRYDMPLHRDPDPLPDCDILVVESTYGDRRHETTTVQEQVRDVFAETIRRRGIVLIPAFAVGRVQLVTLMLRDLMVAGELPEVPIHIDSPMAIDATLIYGRHLYHGNLDAEIVADGRSRLFPREVHLHRTVHESKWLNTLDGPRVIVASSGMMTGGRILHHLIRRLPRHENLVLLTGFQAAGTRGRALQDGAKKIRIHGQDVPVNARHATIHGLSSHADRDELDRWLGTCRKPPRRVFVVHGEESSSMAFARRVEQQLGAEVTVPELGQSFEV